MFPSLFSNDEHLAEMALGSGVAFEAVLVAALFLAHLAVPSELLEAFCFHSIGEMLSGG